MMSDDDYGSYAWCEECGHLLGDADCPDCQRRAAEDLSIEAAMASKWTKRRLFFEWFDGAIMGVLTIALMLISLVGTAVTLSPGYSEFAKSMSGQCLCFE